MECHNFSILLKIIGPAYDGVPGLNVLQIMSFEQEEQALVPPS